jgi:hypothetical protein
MQFRFAIVVENITLKYRGKSDPAGHAEKYWTLWSSVPEMEQTQKFIHTLDTIPKN